MLGRERERESLAIVIIWWWWWEFFNLPSLIKSRNFFFHGIKPCGSRL